METILGIRGKDFVMLAADSTRAQSIIIMNDDNHKLYKINDKLMIAAIGDAGDAVQFTEFISKNIALYKMRNGYDLSAKSATHFTRKNLAEYLRSSKPYQVNLFVAGYDDQDGPQLHYIDYLANTVPLSYGGQGYGGYFSLTVMDRYFQENLTQDRAYDVMKKCVIEIQRRLLLSLKQFHVSVVDKNGIRDLEPITSSNLINYRP